MTDFSYLEARFQELVGRAESLVEQLIERLPAGDERQAFLDKAALAYVSGGRPSASAYHVADNLWEERQKRRGLPSERELVVRYLNRMACGRGNIGVPTDGLELLADAIKAGKHLEVPADPVGEKFSG